MPPPSRIPRVAVIDIGSNSIKVLVAARDPQGQLRALHNKTLDARISAGLSAEKPRLSDEGMTRGLGAIRELLMDLETFRPDRIELVATSAVRDASNGAEFCRKIKAATKQDIRVLSGTEEANAIGRGLTCDPALADLEDFYLFDLGGGSLECLAYRDRKVRQAHSLPLGCVRLTEKFVTDPTAAFPAEARAAVSEHVKAEIAAAAFKFDLSPDAAGIATGGSMATVRAIFGALEQKKADETPPEVSVNHLRQLLDHLSAATLEQRKRMPGLPSSRADVFPVALTTFIAVAEAAGVETFQHSFYNLRWGLADEML